LQRKQGSLGKPGGDERKKKQIHQRFEQPKLSNKKLRCFHSILRHLLPNKWISREILAEALTKRGSDNKYWSNLSWKSCQQRQIPEVLVKKPPVNKKIHTDNCYRY